MNWTDYREATKKRFANLNRYDYINLGAIMAIIPVFYGLWKLVKFIS